MPPPAAPPAPPRTVAAAGDRTWRCSPRSGRARSRTALPRGTPPGPGRPAGTPPAPRLPRPAGRPRAGALACTRACGSVERPPRTLSDLLAGTQRGARDSPWSRPLRHHYRTVGDAGAGPGERGSGEEGGLATR